MRPIVWRLIVAALPGLAVIRVVSFEFPSIELCVQVAATAHQRTIDNALDNRRLRCQTFATNLRINDAR
jgi:hypothetical protein